LNFDRAMAVWYQVESHRIDDFIAALSERGAAPKPLIVDGVLVGISCRRENVATDLEVHLSHEAGRVSIVRHEGIHLLRPIQFRRLHAAIVDSLAQVGAQVE
jgi:hypothetical protein